MASVASTRSTRTMSFGGGSMENHRVENIMEIVGLKKEAVKLLSTSPKLCYLHFYNEHRNPNVKSHIRSLLNSNVPIRNTTKAEQFVDFYSNYCLPSQRHMLPDEFDGYMWADFLETKSREGRLEPKPTAGWMLFLFCLATFLAGILFPTLLLTRPTADRTQVILDTLCATNEGLQIPVDCSDVKCTCCVEVGTMESC